jgi:hypothetical protein
MVLAGESGLSQIYGLAKKSGRESVQIAPTTASLAFQPHPAAEIHCKTQTFLTKTTRPSLSLIARILDGTQQSHQISAPRFAAATQDSTHQDKQIVPVKYPSGSFGR